MSRRARGEGGAVAVLTALVFVLLMSIGALAIDLGNAMVRQRDTQSQADFSALAGAGVNKGECGNVATDGLPAATPTPTATDPAILCAAAYLYKNQPQNDTATARLTAAQLAINLTDTIKSNGEAYYGDFSPKSPLDPDATLTSNPNELTIVTPPAIVKFGFAQVMGFSSTKVQTTATAAVGSPAGTSIMPMFAVQSSNCDYGLQNLTEPANGHQVNTTPVLDYSPGATRGNDATISGITKPLVVAPNSYPRIEIGDTSTADFQISGAHLTSTTWVGFFRDTAIYPDAPTHVAVPASAISGFRANNGNGQMSFPISSIPDAVRNTQGAWYARLSSSAPVAPATEPTQWSPATSAVPFQVGDFAFRCTNGSNAGNFGTLKIPRTDGNPSTWIPKNISDGLQRPLTLAKWPATPPATPPALCVPGTPPTIYSTGSTLLAKTNCVDTDTGLTANTVTAGLVAAGGRLVKNAGKTSKAPYDTGTCDPNGVSTSGSVPGLSPVNNDTLTCFMTDPAMQLSTIASASYAGPPVLSEAIYSSPRFFWIPVLGTPPTNGGSQHYTIVAVRPVFLTDQPLGATRANRTACAAPSGSCLTYNGLGMSGSRITRLTVFFFNDKALPNIAGNAPTADYFGTGPKVAVLNH